MREEKRKKVERDKERLPTTTLLLLTNKKSYLSKFLTKSLNVFFSFFDGKYTTRKSGRMCLCQLFSAAVFKDFLIKSNFKNDRVVL